MADERFSFPAREFFRASVTEAYPSISVQEGSVVHDFMILPMAVMNQKLLDRLNVSERNLSIKDNNIMLDSEMDRLASNYFVERQGGSFCYGVVRLYLIRQVSVIISDSVYIIKDDNRYNPVAPRSYSLEDLKYDSISGQYFIEVTFQAINEGPEYRLFSGDVVEVIGLNNVSVNGEVSMDFTQGSYRDTNADLYNRILDSVTNNELVKSNAISKILKDQFPSIKNISVIGYGDKGMMRDRLSVPLPIDPIISLSFCSKMNVPLDRNGNVKWYDDYGNINTKPEGGWTGAVFDEAGRDFDSLLVSWDQGTTYQNVRVLPGFVLRLFHDNIDGGDYRINQVQEAPISPGAERKKLLILDRQFTDTSTDENQYKLLGNVVSNDFHAGGKVDILVDSVNNEEKTVVIGRADGDRIIEIPLVDYDITFTLGGNTYPWYEDNVPFTLPVLTIIRVDQVAQDDDNRIERELIYGRDYSIVRKEFRQKFSTADYDVLRIFTRDEYGLNPYVDKRLKITYLSNNEFATMQSFLDAPENKTLDLKIMPPQYMLLNVEVSYAGDISEDTMKQILADYIYSTSFGATISASEVVSLMSSAGATFVSLPLTLKATLFNPDGSVDTVVSSNKIELDWNQIFYPESELSITNE